MCLAVPPFLHLSEWFHAQLSTREAVSELRRLVDGLSSPRPGFAPGSVHVGYVVDKVALGQVFVRVLRFFPVSIIPPWIHI
jgi:hypothetical protein